jgi:DNA-directed RNA polymerase beta' subunit
MARLLKETEIQNIMDFLEISPFIPEETGLTVINNIKNKIRKQLEKEKVYPAIIPELKNMIKESYENSLIQAGESVGVICAQSIGEKQTQTTLNSLDWKEKILYMKNNNTIVENIGEMIDTILEKNKDNITHIEENRTEYLELDNGFMIPSTDKNGMVGWYKIEAITRHLPVGKLVRVKTQSGREITATQSKSFLVWNGKEFEATLGSDIKVGDLVPTTSYLSAPKTTTYFEMETIFPKSEYIYTSEVLKAINYQKNNGGLQSRTKNTFVELNGKEYTLPYNRYDTMLGKRKKYFEHCQTGLIYIHKANEFVSHIPDKIPLDNDFGFFIGLYLAEGWSTDTFVGISNKDQKIRKRITNFCDRYGITYHLVMSEAKNVRNGTSIDLKIHSVLLARLFKSICGTGSVNKKIPTFVYTAPENFITGLVDGYFSGDGTIDIKDGSVNVASVSEDLITGISFILSYFNVFGKFSSVQPLKNNVGSKNIKRIYTLNIRNGYAQNFAQNFTLTEDQKQNKLRNITIKKNYKYIHGKSQETFPFDRNVYFDEVVSVEFVDGSTEYVYDLTVETTRNFQLWNGLNCRDTFHKAGMSEKTMTQGVPRFQELINATKKPRIVNNKIYLRENNTTIEDIRASVNSKIVGLTFFDIAVNIEVIIDKEPEKWYESFKILYHDNFINHPHCISIKLNKQKLVEYRITMQEISDFIHKEYDDLYCVFSPPSNAQIDIFVDTSNIELPEERVSFINSDNIEEIYLEECVQPILEKMNICGIEGITEIFFTQENNEWIIETNGINSRSISTQYVNFKNLLALDIVDNTRTISNNVWDIYEVLGIEAAREFLIEEFMNIMEGINSCHACLLVDRMTYSGNIASITRYTMKKDESGPFGKASFEETMDNFLNAAVKGEVEPTEGVSAAIICGKRANIGTGMVDVKIDISKLPLCKPITTKAIADRAKERVMKRSRERERNKIVNEKLNNMDDEFGNL